MKYREIEKIIIKDGWYLDRQKGSHRQFKHKSKKGLVTIAGKDNSDIPFQTLKSILNQAQIKLK
ncbi:MAG: type II toxin-antitoxin system HicA family toxin [Chitinophagaceae bacterium]